MKGLDQSDPYVILAEQIGQYRRWLDDQDQARIAAHLYKRYDLSIRELAELLACGERQINRLLIRWAAALTDD